MRRQIGWLIVLATVLIAPDDPKDALRALLPKQEFVKDDDFVAKPGDRFAVQAGEAAVAARLPDLIAYHKATKAKDRQGLDELFESKAVSLVPRGTKLLILETFRPAPIPRAPRTGLTGEQVGREIMEATLAGKQAVDNYAVKVRFTEGPLDGRAMYVPESDLIPMVPKPTPTWFVRQVAGDSDASRESLRRPAIPEGPGSTSARLLAAARRLDRRGEIVEAIGAYWHAMIEDTKAPEAEQAAARLAAMGFRREPDGKYVLETKRPLRTRRRR